jgi:ribosomal-protein-alanine N-acetyltransferase
MIEFFPRPRIFVDRVVSEDVDAMAEIHQAGFRRGWSADEFDALLGDPMVTGLGLRRQSSFGPRRLIGFVLVRTILDQAEVLSVAVEPARRGRGHGRQLMEAALRELYSERVPELFLEVDEANAPAVTLYRRLGFVEVGKRKGYYGDEHGQGGTALVMKLQIEQQAGPGERS